MDQPPAGRTGIAVLVMVVTPLLFSSNLIFGRSVVPEVAPFTLAFMRWALVALALLPFLARERRKAFEIMASGFGIVLLLGFLGMWICGGIVYLALGSTTATNGTLIMTTSPIIIILLEALFSGRRIRLLEGLGSVIAFAGIAVIVLEGNLASLASLAFNSGDLLMVAGAIAWAGYSILYRSRRLGALSNLALFAVVSAAGAVTLAPFALYEFLSGGAMPVTRGAWTGIAGIVIFSSLLAFSGFQLGVRALGPSLAGIFMYLMPPYGVFLAVTFLDEAFQPYHEAGIALVMGGVILATFPVTWLRERFFARD